MELPHAEALHRELNSQGFALLTVTQDPGSEVLKMVEYNGITHSIVSDNADPVNGNVYKKYHAYDGKHYLIGSDGTILAAFSKKELAKYGIQPPTTKFPSTPVPQAVPGLKIAPAPAQKDPVAWAFPATVPTGAAGGKISLDLMATIAPGWYIYAMSQKSGGPTPTTITLPADQPFKLAGQVVEPKPEVKFDAGFGMEVHQLKGSARFSLPVTVAKAPPGKRSVVIEARYQACNSNLCLPAKTQRIEIPVVLK